MKLASFIGFIHVIMPHLVTSNIYDGSTTDLGTINSTESFHDVTWLAATTVKESMELMDSKYPNQTEILLYTVIRKLRNSWNQDGNKDLFTGRCIQLAKKIRSLIPIAIFKMGIIMTLLTFLTMFSVKSLGLLGLLLLINTSGAVAKVTAAFAHKEEKHPSTVHFHIHKDEGYQGGYHIGHSGPDHDWDRKLKINQDLIGLDRMESYNLYNKLLSDLASKNYKIV